MALLCPQNSVSQCPFHQGFFHFMLFLTTENTSSQAYLLRETLWHVIVSAKKERRKSYNDSYLNFIFLCHFPIIVSPLYSPRLTVTLSWHGEHCWTVDCETWYNNFLPCFWFYGKSKCPMKRGQWETVQCEWHMQLQSFKPRLNVIKRLFKVKRSLQAIILWEKEKTYESSLLH